MVKLAQKISRNVRVKKVQDSFIFFFYIHGRQCDQILIFRHQNADTQAHWLYRFLEDKKTSRFYFSVPDLQGIHSNLKQKQNFNFREGFFRKSPFCTFSCIYSGFGGPWVMIRKKILIAIFIMLQKNNFGQKKF